MFSTVLGVLMEDESIQWCYYSGELSSKELSDILILKYNDYEEAKKLVKEDILHMSVKGPIYRNPKSKQKPFQDLKTMKKALKDDVKRILIHSEYEGWHITRLKEKIDKIRR